MLGIVRWFFTRTPLAVACAFAVLLAGCDPENVIRWSPDGAHAIVRGADSGFLDARIPNAFDQTFLVNGDGKIVGKIPGAREWMPDSRRVIAVRGVKPRNWAEVASLMGEERAQAVARSGQELALLVHGYHGDWDKFFDLDAIKHWDDSHPNLSASYAGFAGSPQLLSLYYLQENDPDSAAPLIAGLSKEVKAIVDAIQMGIVSELLVKSALGNDAADERVLLRTVDPIGMVHPSPNGRGIAVVIDEPIRPALYVIPSDGGDRLSVDSGASEADWTPDGQWLTYAKTTLSYAALEDQMLLGTITRCKVCDDDGRFLSKVENPEDLAGVPFAKGANRVACLPDGRILFAGVEVGLPMTTQDFRSKSKLFALRLGKTPRIERIVSDEVAKKLPARVDFFSLSPDGRRAAIAGENGEVAIVTIESGKVQEIQGGGESVEMFNQKQVDLAIPSWRSSTEFSCVCPPGKSGAGAKRAEVALRSLDGPPRVISAAWTDEMTDSFLMRPKPGK